MGEALLKVEYILVLYPDQSVYQELCQKSLVFPDLVVL
ncbi:hypothetical protein Xen7305DRAFT_00036200 [Xenococcus sp. PCC 7305]|nr:hypothetical protein Xen7305DRAFT_00036200 [Xenococcus sp. PCC 7305]